MIRVSNTIEKTEDNFGQFTLSKVRIVRNIKGYPFEDNLSFDKKNKLENEIIEYISNSRETAIVFDTTNLTEIEKRYFIENCLEKDDFFNKKNAKFVYFEKNKLILILNSKEHIKISITNPNLSLKEKYEEVIKLENKIGSRFEYCVSPKYGFLTQHIRNCGLGIKLSVLVHLPGLFFIKEKNSEIITDLEKKGYFIDKWQTSDKSGFFYVISSKLNFGVSEEKLIERFIQGIKSLLDIDKEILIDYYINDKGILEDIIFRSFGILKYARRMEQNEALAHISNLMMGIDLNLELPLSRNTLNILVREVLDGNVNLLAEREKIVIDYARTDLVKRYLSVGENYV